MTKGKNNSQWDNREEFLYYFYLQLKYAEYESYATKKAAKVFIYFAALIGTKDQKQVKSHHQNILKRHLTIRNYLQFYETQNFCKLQQFQDKYMTNKLKSYARQYQERSMMKPNDNNQQSTPSNQMSSATSFNQIKNDNVSEVSEAILYDEKNSSLITEERESQNDELMSFSIPQLYL